MRREGHLQILEQGRLSGFQTCKPAGGRIAERHGDVKRTVETKRLPMMPVRDVVIFPYMMTPFVVGRESSVRALEEALAGEKKIFLATQHDASVDEPKPDEIYQVGTIVNIVQSLKLPTGTSRCWSRGWSGPRPFPSPPTRATYAPRCGRSSTGSIRDRNWKP